MVRITNGVMTLRVTRASFLSQYQPCGYQLVESSEELTEEELYVSSSESVGTQDGEVFQPKTDVQDEGEEPEEVQPETEPEAAPEEPDEEPEEAEEPRELSEIPLSEMDFYQLCAYADQLGLDRKGLRSKKEIRQLIRSNL